MNLSIEQRRALMQEVEAIQREYASLQGDTPVIRKQKLKLRNRYEEIDRLLGAAAAKAELLSQDAETVPPVLGEAAPHSDATNGGRVKCPYCAEDIQADAKKCRFCGEWLVTVSGGASPTVTPIPEGTVTAKLKAEKLQQKADSLQQLGNAFTQMGCSLMSLGCLILVLSPFILAAIFYFLSLFGF